MGQERSPDSTPDASSVTHGFLRTPDGSFTTFPAHGGSLIVTGLNRAGAITGNLADVKFPVTSGVLRQPNGTFTIFHIPGSSLVFPSDINSAETITGTFSNDTFVSHAFLRALDGTLTVFDAPGSGGGGTIAVAINDAGATTGYYTDAKSLLVRSFLRGSDGAFTTFSAPGGHTSVLRYRRLEH